LGAERPADLPSDLGLVLAGAFLAAVAMHHSLLASLADTEGDQFSPPIWQRLTREKAFRHAEKCMADMRLSD
jgi:hypothetical protein